jgi:hypothetical protein
VTPDAGTFTNMTDTTGELRGVQRHDVVEVVSGLACSFVVAIAAGRLLDCGDMRLGNPVWRRGMPAMVLVAKTRGADASRALGGVEAASVITALPRAVLPTTSGRRAYPLTE